MKFESGYSPDSVSLVDDIQEIRNYVSALSIASESMKESSLGLSLDLVKTAHFHLMNNTRGQDKNPGKFRTIQNYIGHPGATLNEMTFVPIAPEKLTSALDRMGELSSYWRIIFRLVRPTGSCSSEDLIYIPLEHPQGVRDDLHPQI